MIFNLSVKSQTCFLLRDAPSEPTLKQSELSIVSQDSYVNQIVINLLPFLTNAFQVAPDVRFSNYGNKNAKATLNNIGGGNSIYGTIIIDQSLVHDECTTTFNTCTSLPFILSHEYAHICQFYYKIARFNDKRDELFADYLAGCAFASLKMQGYFGNNFQNINNMYFLTKNSFFSKGDYDFYDLNHHGTPEERALSFDSGIIFFERYCQNGCNINMYMNAAYSYSNNLRF